MQVVAAAWTIDIEHLAHAMQAGIPYKRHTRGIDLRYAHAAPVHLSELLIADAQVFQLETAQGTVEDSKIARTRPAIRG